MAPTFTLFLYKFKVIKMPMNFAGNKGWKSRRRLFALIPFWILDFAPGEGVSGTPMILDFESLTSS